MKYSIIIPVHNAEKYLEKCIKSVLSQSIEDFELILIDDGSKDNSLKVCNRFADQDHRVMVIHQDNAGVSAARNAGLRAAKGYYILFVDSDDFVSEDYLSTIDQYAGEYDLLTYGHFDYMVDENGNEIECKKSNYSIETDEDEHMPWEKLFMRSFFASPWNKLFKRDLLIGMTFDEHCVCYEDYIFNTQYCERIKSFRIISNPVYYYRQSVSTNPVSKRRWGQRFEISKKVADVTQSFIERHKDYPRISELSAYPYGAFIVELHAAKEVSKTEFLKAANAVVRERNFQNVLFDMQRAGTRIRILYRMILWKQYRIASCWLREALVK